MRFAYKMTRCRHRLKLIQTLTATPLCLLLMVHLIVAASSVDLTTTHPTASRTTAVTSRSVKSKITPSNTLTKPPAAEKPSLADDREELLEPQHTLVALSSKSYINGPTTVTSTTSTQPPKLTKRAGIAVDPKIQKPLNRDSKNRTRETESRKKLHSGATDHIPDSSGHIPYRIGRPLLSPPDYDGGASGTGASGSGGGFHGPPYEPDRWQQEYWEHDYHKQLAYNSTRVQHIEAECQDDYMKIRIGFNGSFSGLLYSAGYAYDPDCMYINGSGRDYYEFYIQLNRCGTLGKNAQHDEKRKNPTNFMWNTVTVQYNPLIEEEYDEHFKVTCEYGYDFWKTVTFPFLDVEVATGNPVVFTLSPPECYMEIQNGYGIGGPRVTGPVRVGDPLTLIIYMRSKYDGFDIVVNDCYAHNGANKRIQLIDDYGCPVDDKLISRFRGSWSDSGVFETQVYAYMKTFRFTGSPALYIECDVRMCHGRCPSQPCHWRNLKAVTKRDISNATSMATATTLLPPAPLTAEAFVTEKPNVPLSENVNLFQALRVLQEGESDDTDELSVRARRLDAAVHQTCLKTSTFSALSAALSLLFCTLAGALVIACARLKQRSKEASLYDNYVTHKGQID